VDERLSRVTALLEVMVATVILGSTLVLVKLALVELPPLTITALRYAFASLVLLPFLVRHNSLSRYPLALWVRFAIIGLGFYVIGNGALYVGLQFIPAATGSLLLSLVPTLVVLGGVVWLGEIPTRAQVVGIVVALGGSVVFFSPELKPGELRGIAIVAIGLGGNATFGIVGREIALKWHPGPVARTALPLGIGSSVLVPLALLLDGIPRASFRVWGLVVWLAVVNTTLVYTLLNHALSVLAAFEESAILSLTPFATALWAWLLLRERLQPVQLLGMAVVVLGVVLVEWTQP
jgi:drug/metabolite transporter (DMT)-like permease